VILASEHSLVAASLALGAPRIKGWSQAELRLIAEARSLPRSEATALRREICAGEDPLGESFCLLRSPAKRRKQGATYTPYPIVRAMVAWARRDEPKRVVDAGVGSGRFLTEAAQAFPKAQLIGFEVDPLAAILARANLAALGLQKRSRIVLCDYRRARLDNIVGKTLFIGNPPYVRHHDVSPHWKQWLTTEARKRHLPVSQLSGLHVHFFLATQILAKTGDYGAFVTSAEWLDVNYGSLVRGLLLNGLGGTSITLLDPRVHAFPDAATTAVITTFVVGGHPKSIQVRKVHSLTDLTKLSNGRSIRRDQLERERRWSHLTMTPRRLSAGFVELGELCRVHRGQVTGSNRVWIAGDHSGDLPTEVLYPAVTRARELFDAGIALQSTAGLRSVIDLPSDLSVYDAQTRRALERFLSFAKALGADATYIARHRRPWWSVSLHPPAPILATYMARRPPAFVRNLAGVRHLNIAHGIYPRERLPKVVLRRLTDYLSRAVTTSEGRTYAGGLTKFEPREMERIPVPGPELLLAES